jgi:hypothetical protein
MAIDGRGSLVVCDKGNHLIRVIDVKDGRVVTLTTPFTKGSGKAGGIVCNVNRQGLFYPEHAAINGDGDIIVSDSGNHRLCCLSGCCLTPP